MIIFQIIISFLVIEILLQIFIRSYKRNFKWFINDDDEFPKFDEAKLKNFLSKSFDYKLGWKQKLNTSGFLHRNQKTDTSHNHRKLINKKKKKLIATFGDSYVFSNHMCNANTWEEQIPKKNNFNVLNYGVGNYGLDQAILKYESSKIPKSIKIVIMGFVPETITRIQSRWKHYTEFGNINGFKPKFDLINGKLVLRPNPINSKITIQQMKKVIFKLRKSERFYKDKFLKYKFQFPYIFYFIRNFKFNVKISMYLIMTDLFKVFKNHKMCEKLDNIKFYLIIERNVKEAHILYKESYSKKLLTNLIEKFEKTAYKKKHLPLIIIFPQPQDINLRSSQFYEKFFNKFSKDKNILDLSFYFNKVNYNKYFLNDKYGGHLNKKGNIYVAKIIDRHLKKYFKR